MRAATMDSQPELISHCFNLKTQPRAASTTASECLPSL
jgi:hypothetical protein